MLWHAGEVKLPKISPPEGTDKTATPSSLSLDVAALCYTSVKKEALLQAPCSWGEVWGLLTLQQVEGTRWTTRTPGSTMWVWAPVLHSVHLMPWDQAEIC